MAHRVWAVLVLFLLLGACRTAQIFEIRDAPVNLGSSREATGNNVKDAIVRAGTSLGWAIVDKGPGELQGVLNLRTHSATVRIPYNTKTYSILYADSTNLNAKDGQIHSNYVGWVQNLDGAIRRELLRTQ